MKDIIINQPQLQSLQQRLGSWFLSGMSWLLWLYFLLPLFTLAGWLLGVKSWADEIRWFGGYKTLLELLQTYVGIIVLIFLVWLVWTCLLSWIHASIRPKQKPAVTDKELAETFAVKVDKLGLARKSNKLNVYFDEHAQIIVIDTLKP